MSARFEGRRVVDAVAGHRHDLVLALQRADDAELVLGRHTGEHRDLTHRGVELVVVEVVEIGADEHPVVVGDAEVGGDRHARSAGGRR